MAITSAQLSAAITSSQTLFGLTNISANQSGLPPVGAVPLSIGNPMQIDTEVMFVIAQPVAGTVIVRSRGSDGTAASAHDLLANVYASASVADFGNPGLGQSVNLPPQDAIAISIGQDQTLVIPPQNATWNINKATAAAITLPAAPLNGNGLFVIITSNTAAAHVVTATGLFMDGTAAAPKNTATFTAGKGASLTLVAENGFWTVNAVVGITFA